MYRQPFKKQPHVYTIILNPGAWLESHAAGIWSPFASDGITVDTFLPCRLPASMLCMLESILEAESTRISPMLHKIF